MPWLKKRAQLIPCLMVIHDKGDTIQRASCLSTRRQSKAKKRQSNEKSTKDPVGFYKTASPCRNSLIRENALSTYTFMGVNNENPVSA